MLENDTKTKKRNKKKDIEASNIDDTSKEEIVENIVDTTGAGDFFAAGFFYVGFHFFVGV